MWIRDRFQVNHNIKAYDRIYDEYEKKHGEIFNSIEQERLHKKLEQAIKSIRTESREKTGLDYGCGSGNITRHLIELGVRTVAADLSRNFLNLVSEKYSHTGLLDVKEIDGQSLSNIGNDRFDLVATYSVLHHVPDYFEIIKEMVRVLKLGGIIYLDHELNESYWNRDTEYVKFLEVAWAKPKKRWRKYFKASNYLFKLRRIIQPRYSPEGDIHTFPEDHMEWDKIEGLLVALGCEVVLKEDYLLYRRGYKTDVYREYESRCNDMRLLVARKKCQRRQQRNQSINL